MTGTATRRTTLRRSLALVAQSSVAAVAVWLLICALLWLAVPPLLKWQAETRLGASLGRAVTIGAVDFDPFRLDLRVTAVRIDASPLADSEPSRARPASPLLTIGTLHVDFAVSSIVELAPVIEALEIDNVRLRVTRTGPGRYDIDDFLQRLAPRQSSTATSAAQPTRFALYNLQLRDAAVRFDDRPAARIHEVSALDLALPFLSNLPAQVDVKVTPRLSFRLNGVPFRSDGFATPFAATRAGELRLSVRALDLKPYAGYLPMSWPLRLENGTLAADVSLGFSAPPSGTPTWVVQGTASLSDVRVADAAGDAVVAWNKLAVDLRRVEPLARRIALSAVRLDGAQVQLQRGVDGVVGGSLAGLAATPPARPTSAASPRPIGSGASAPSEPVASPEARGAQAASNPWRIDVDRIDVVDGAVEWSDATVQPAAALRLGGVRLQAKSVHWPLRQQPIAFTADASLGAQAASRSTDGRLAVRGSASPSTATLEMSLKNLPLDAFAGYWAQWLVPEVDGRASADVQVDWSSGAEPGSRTRIAIASAAIDGPALRSPSSDVAAANVPFAARRLALTDAQVDLASRGLTIADLAIDAPALALARGRDGQIDASRWIVVPADPSAPPWRIDVGRTRLAGGRVQWTDAAARRSGPPVRLALADLRVALETLRWDGDRPTVPAQFEASGRLGAPLAAGEPDARLSGTFDWRGVVGVAPLEVIGRMKAERLPLHLLVPYVENRLPVRIAHLELGIDGQLSVRERPNGVDVDAGADLLFGAVRIDSVPGVRTPAPAETLLSWNTLALKGVRVDVKPGARTKLDVDQATLADFATRLAVTEDGRLNLRQATADGTVRGPATPRPASPAAEPLPVDVRVNETLLSNGRIDFSDHFVRPNYSAALTGLSGRIGTVDSAKPGVAPLRLRGQAAGTAQLEIDGTVDPLARPPTFDMRARATDLELAPLSPYAGKYAGYAIERGKLSMDVSYRLGADGRLEASNRVVLNQLTFGDRIDSPAATSLPVLFAVALLKDRNGVIDLDLPVSGSLDDPQFSVAALIGRLLRNLLAKALTSPFSLLTRGAGVGGETTDPGRVDFVPGTPRLADAGIAAVATVAEALVQKPALLLTVTGSADASREQDAYRSALLEERIEAERRSETVAAATAATAQSAPPPPLTPDERERIVQRLYRDADLPDKPRNVFGLPTDLPLADMEVRLKAVVLLTPDAARGLALQRGVNVRDALIARGLPSDRLFLAAPRTDASSGAPEWRPQAELALTPR